MNLYIPRINAKYTEADVIRIFDYSDVAVIGWVDFVALKDDHSLVHNSISSSSSSANNYCSAFVRVEEWKVTGSKHAEHIIESKQSALFLEDSKINKWSRSTSRLEILDRFWILLPAKVTVPRTKSNLHQIASYTDMLFQHAEQQSRQLAVQEKKIDDLMEMVLRLTSQMESMASSSSSCV